MYNEKEYIKKLKKENAELKQENAKLKNKVLERDKRIENLEAIVLERNERVKKLEEELSIYKLPPKNSSNSGLSPSSDKGASKYPKREKSNKKPGGQLGHQGYHAELVDDPDKVIKLKYDECPLCGSKDIKETEELIRRQEWGLKIEREVTEYQSLICKCANCKQKINKGFPEGINAPVVYSNQITALTSYLHSQMALSIQKTAHLFRDIFRLALSEGTIVNNIRVMAERSQPLYADILDFLKKSKVIGSDETSLKINGKRAYVWVFQNEGASYFVTHFSRGFKVILLTIGKSLLVFWISDRYSAQLKIEAQHQYCLAHILRYCMFAIEANNSKWATNLKELLIEAIELRKTANFDPQNIDFSDKIKNLKQRLSALLSKPPPGGEEVKNIKGLSGKENELLLFLEHLEVPYDNNGSERALRNIAVKRKVSGGFRTLEGANDYCIITSVIETCKKQGRNIFLTLCQILEGKQILLNA